MGVHKDIARFFVDRKPPENNSFWKGRLLYVGMGNGFVSIPVFYDILYRLGVPMEKLLEEGHVYFMEQLMHYAMLQERNKISKAQELDQLCRMLQGRVKDFSFYNDLNRYLEQPVLKPMGLFGMEHPSLNRADVFLYVICDLPLNKKQQELALRYWYALHPSYLIIDDVRDYAQDIEENEENVVTDLGGGAVGFEKTIELLRKNGEIMSEINPALAKFLVSYEGQLEDFVPKNN